MEQAVGSSTEKTLWYACQQNEGQNELVDKQGRAPSATVSLRNISTHLHRPFGHLHMAGDWGRLSCPIAGGGGGWYGFKGRVSGKREKNTKVSHAC